MRNKLFSERFELNITKRQKTLLENKAAKKEMTMNEVIRELINVHCKE